MITDLFETNTEAWLIWFDGGRYDYFEELYDEYFTGELSKAWNGDIGYTGDWAVRHLEQDFSGYGLFSSVTLRSARDVDYDGRDHFDVAPRIETEDNSSMKEKLATLGYLEQSGELADTGEEAVNEAVLNHKSDISGGVIRYPKPHPPFDGLEHITSGASKTRETREALISGELTEPELHEAYRSTYRTGFELASQIIPKLDGTVIVTADHGECLDCGQLFHDRYHRPHDHLTHVPWFEVESVKD
ncbi:hypothetical protein C479_03546 [Halovivax asiaticus JCM 14624]|uniref:Uncharacterized protein n=1 Tax=Halovivax asiaticus JCM 14624 TaxID=1227490 RepID=M0BU10_9EURY|nr:hypothetical protein C479_03546 [Halovivax asiaticus JCM 14624]